MSALPTDLPSQPDARRRACVDCAAEWTAIDSPRGSMPEECPECGGGSVDAELRAALAGVEPWAVEAIRRDERSRLATMIDQHAETISRFAGEPTSVAKLVAFMVSLEG